MKMKFRHLRKIVKVKQFLKNERLSNTIVIGIFAPLILKEALKQSMTKKVELIILIAFTVVLVLSAGLTFTFITRLFGQKHEADDKAEKSKTGITKTMTLVGFVAVIVLAVLTDFSMFNVRAILFGVYFGICIAIYSLLGKGAKKIWGNYKKRKRQKYFDRLNDRPENRRRNAAESEGK